MVLTKNRVMFTYEDLKNWEPDNFRHEIIEGEHIMSPSPRIPHQEIVRKLTIFLSKYVEETKLGRIFVSPVDVVFHESDVCVPDLVFVSTENLAIVREENIQGAPDLVIEVLSPGSEKRDREVKYKRYAYYGVKEYWIVDPERRLVEVYDLAANQLLQVVPKIQPLSTPLFPDLDLDLATVF
ncbi:MAG: Uma2 family endonuclease [Calditrichaceae bacterium]|nr:Uma2 family endonuclease [Calditrichia bacterium]NUQ44148.1 Uma2 family endonuclease [Calditrichaceae bacterium]